MSAPSTPDPRELHVSHEPGEPDESERVSVTDVNGTIARFEMSYSPPTGERRERLVFRPPRSAYAGGAAYLAFALALVVLEVLAYTGSSNSRLYVWLVEGDRGRPLPSAVLAAVILVSALGTLLRTHLRGVVVRADGVEARYLVALGLPRVKKWAWPQIHRIVVDEAHVAFELWDGNYEKLPPVADVAGMKDALERIAASRKILVTRLRKMS